MKRFLKWFVAFLQFLFGLAAFAAIGFYIFDKFDIAQLKDTEYLKYVAYGCAGLFVVLSVVVMAIAASGKKARGIVIYDEKRFCVNIGEGKIYRLVKKAAAACQGVALKKMKLQATSSGYVLMLKINIAYRNANEAATELKLMCEKLCADVYGISFAGIQVNIGKVKSSENVDEAKQEARTAMELSAAVSAAPALETGGAYILPTASEPAYESPAQYFAPEPEPEPAVEIKPANAGESIKDPEPSYTLHSAATESAAAQSTVLRVDNQPKEEPLIKVTTAKPASQKSSAKAPAAASALKKKTTAGGTAAKPAKQKVDPGDPPPFKL